MSGHNSLWTRAILEAKPLPTDFGLSHERERSGYVDEVHYSHTKDAMRVLKKGLLVRDSNKQNDGSGVDLISKI